MFVIEKQVHAVNMYRNLQMPSQHADMQGQAVALRPSSRGWL
jgi:hypothetical protein